jgi:hypothetical protein
LNDTPTKLNTIQLPINVVSYLSFYLIINSISLQLITMSSKDVIKRQLLDNMKNLLVNHGVSHKEIIDDIHDEIIELSKTLPKFEVLYNNAYGGYGFSKEFILFVKQNQQESTESINPYEYRYDNVFRRQAVQYILPFGQYILDKYPILKAILVIYHHSNLNDIVSTINSMYYSEDKLKALYKRRDELRRCLAIEYLQGNKMIKMQSLDDASNNCDESDESDESKEYETNEETMYALIHYNYVEFEGYTKECYEELLVAMDKEIDETLTKLDEKKTNCISKYKLTDTNFDEIRMVIYSLMKNAESYSLHNKHDYNFLEAIKKYGVDDNRIWKHQQRYNELALQYLMIKSKQCIPQIFKETYVYDYIISNSYIKINDEDYNKIVKNFGLSCASSQYCSLEIAEVPEYINWYVGEYDGLEEIVLQ